MQCFVCNAMFRSGPSCKRARSPYCRLPPQVTPRISPRQPDLKTPEPARRVSQPESSFRWLTQGVMREDSNPGLNNCPADCRRDHPSTSCQTSTTVNSGSQCNKSQSRSCISRQMHCAHNSGLRSQPSHHKPCATAPHAPPHAHVLGNPHHAETHATTLQHPHCGTPAQSRWSLHPWSTALPHPCINAPHKHARPALPIQHHPGYHPNRTTSPSLFLLPMPHTQSTTFTA